MKLVNKYYYPNGKLDHLKSIVSDEDKSRIVDQVAKKVAGGMKLAAAAFEAKINVSTYYSWQRRLRQNESNT